MPCRLINVGVRERLRCCHSDLLLDDAGLGISQSETRRRFIVSLNVLIGSDLIFATGIS